MRLAKDKEFLDPPSGVAETPPGTRIYALGDIHGRLDLLTALEEKIQEDAMARPAGRPVVVYLGDFVDRGPDSAGVIEHLSTGPLPGFEAVHLLGNHEAMMLAFLRLGDAAALTWMMNGGEETLASYGVDAQSVREDDAQSIREDDAPFAALRRSLLAALPPRHLDFLESLTRWHVEGGYLFVHAGVHPGRPLDRQDPEDLIWIREPFLTDPGEMDHVVVHGHTPVRLPAERPNRIGVDTGAVYGGALTAVVLEGAGRRYLEVR